MEKRLLTLKRLHFVSVFDSNWAITDRQELIDIVEVVYRGASKGRGLVVSPKGKSSLNPE